MKDPNADATRCGCQSKPSVDGIVLPAVERLQNKLFGGFHTEPLNSDVGALPQYRDTQRCVEVIGGQSDSHIPPTEPSFSPEDGLLSLALVDENTGGNIESLSDFYLACYKRSNITAKSRIIKGHTLFVKDIAHPVNLFERIRGTGGPVPGRTVYNIDAIHAFPSLDPDVQAQIAYCNALNDCYAAGATEGRMIRPIMAHNSLEQSEEEGFRELLYRATPEGVRVLDPIIIRHDGDGWMFGASVSANIHHKPPNHVTKLSEGDRILIHRNIGGLARYLNHFDENNGSISEEVVRPLMTDHKNIADIISSYCPAYDEGFDNSQHIKLVSDISGEGIMGLSKFVEGSKVDIHLSELPLFDRPVINRGQEKWLLPDVTVETNGPLVMIGSVSVIEKIRRRIQEVPKANPTVVGEITRGEGVLSASGDTEIQKYIETFHN